MAIIESGELAAKKIGAAYRIKRSALDEYLGEVGVGLGAQGSGLKQNLGPRSRRLLPEP